MKLNKFLVSASLGLALLGSSCSTTKDVSYFQSLRQGQEIMLPDVTPVKLRQGDKVSIIVSTSDARLNALYNLPVTENNLNNTGLVGKEVTGSTSRTVASYTIDSHGDINFPILGKLHIAGMNREEVAEYVRRELMSRDLVKNPIVTVEYLNLAVSVMGEVTNPGLYTFNRDNFTLLEALSAAGDLTIYGKRNNVKVIREENGMQKVYEIDLGAGDRIAQSPVYYLQQNDIVYVEPNATKARMATPNGNSVLTPTFWISIASFISTIVVLIVK